MADFTYTSGDLTSISGDNAAKASIVNRMFTAIRTYLNSSGWVNADRIASGSVTAPKINAAVAGDGIIKDTDRMSIDLATSSGLTLDGAVTGSKKLKADVDDSTIEISSDKLQVKDEGITASKIAAAVFGAGLNGGAGTAGSVKVDSTGGANIAKALNVDSTNGCGIKVDDSTIGENGSGQLEVKDAGINAAKLASDAVETVKVKDDNITPAKISALYTGDAITNTIDTTFGDKHIKLRWMDEVVGASSSHDFSADIDWSTSDYLTFYVLVYFDVNSGGNALSNVYGYVNPLSGVGAAGGVAAVSGNVGGTVKVLAIGISK